MVKNNDIIPEVLSQISTYISKHDCFNCMMVSHHWYNWFKLQFYKEVYIKTNSQFDKFLQAITASSLEEEKEYTQGYLIKELTLVPFGMNETTSMMSYCPVDLTQERLDLLSDLCPRLEHLEFDSSQWINLKNISTFKKWRNLTSIAPIHCRYLNTSFASTLGSCLNHLRIFHLRHEEDQLFTLFPNMPVLKNLVLEVYCSQSDIQGSFDISQYLISLHRTVPQLETLSLIFTNSLVGTPDLSIMHDQTRLKSLSLKGISNPSNWFQYISNHYPFLESLDIIQPTIKSVNTFVHSDSLAQLVQRLPFLNRLALKGESAYYLYSDVLANELARLDCSIRIFDIDFNTFDHNKSLKFLKSIARTRSRQLTSLQLRVWNQLLPWPGSIKELYYCTGLVDLELSFARGFMDPCHYTQFVIDDFIKIMPQMKRLSLEGADIKLSGGKNGEHMIVELMLKRGKKSSLQVLSLRHSRIIHMNELSQFISEKCTELNQLNLSRCEANIAPRSDVESTQITICRLNLINNRLEELRASTIFFYSGTLYLHNFLAVTVSIENKPELAGLIWWLIKEENHHVYPTYRLATQEERADIKKRYHADDELITGTHLKFGLLRVSCKSLRCLYIDNILLPFHNQS